MGQGLEMLTSRPPPLPEPSVYARDGTNRKDRTMGHKLITVGLTTLLLLAGVCAVMAQDDPAAALAAESAEYCNSTAKDANTSPDVITAKVAVACALLEKEGAAAFPKFQGKDSEFLYEGTYMWIHSLDDGTMLMHPMKYKLNGKIIVSLKDKKGKRFFSTMNKFVKADGEAWVEYYWPKPGTDEIVRKISYVKGCTLPDGRNIVVGSGLYKYDDATVSSLTIN
jgi:signal transduction histidine kinase